MKTSGLREILLEYGDTKYDGPIVAPVCTDSSEELHDVLATWFDQGGTHLVSNQDVVNGLEQILYRLFFCHDCGAELDRNAIVALRSITQYLHRRLKADH